MAYSRAYQQTDHPHNIAFPVEAGTRNFNFLHVPNGPSPISAGNYSTGVVHSVNKFDEEEPTAICPPVTRTFQGLPIQGAFLFSIYFTANQIISAWMPLRRTITTTSTTKINGHASPLLPLSRFKLVKTSVLAALATAKIFILTDRITELSSNSTESVQLYTTGPGFPSLTKDSVSSIKKYVSNGLLGIPNDANQQDVGDVLEPRHPAPQMSDLTLIPMTKKQDKDGLYFSLFAAIAHQLPNSNNAIWNAAIRFKETEKNRKFTLFVVLQALIREKYFHRGKLIPNQICNDFTKEELPSWLEDIMYNNNSSKTVLVQSLRVDKLMQGWVKTRSAYPLAPFEDLIKLAGTTNSADSGGAAQTKKVLLSKLPLTDGETRWFSRSHKTVQLCVNQEESKQTKQDALKLRLTNTFCDVLRAVSKGRQDWLKSWGFIETYGNDSGRTLTYDPFRARGYIDERFNQVQKEVLDGLLKVPPPPTGNQTPTAGSSSVSAVNPKLLSSTTKTKIAGVPVQSAELITSIQKVVREALLADLKDLRDVMCNGMSKYVEENKSNAKLMELLRWQWDIESNGVGLFRILSEALNCKFAIYAGNGEVPTVISFKDSNFDDQKTVVLAHKWDSEGWFSVKEAVNDKLKDINWARYRYRVKPTITSSSAIDSRLQSFVNRKFKT